MEKNLIYDNGDIRLKYLTMVQFKSKLTNKILTGMVIGQEATQFIIWTDKGVTIKVPTHDILQVSVIADNENYYVSLEEYKTMCKNKKINL